MLAPIIDKKSHSLKWLKLYSGRGISKYFLGLHACSDLTKEESLGYDVYQGLTKKICNKNPKFYILIKFEKI